MSRISYIESVMETKGHRWSLDLRKGFDTKDHKSLSLESGRKCFRGKIKELLETQMKIWLSTSNYSVTIIQIRKATNWRSTGNVFPNLKKKTEELQKQFDHTEKKTFHAAPLQCVNQNVIFCKSLSPILGAQHMAQHKTDSQLIK